MFRSSLVPQIFSDNVCPWCFVGKRHLESAIKQFTSKETSSSFDVRWKPFFLNVESPETSEVAIVVSLRRVWHHENACLSVLFDAGKRIFLMQTLYTWGDLRGILNRM